MSIKSNSLKNKKMSTDLYKYITTISFYFLFCLNILYSTFCMMDFALIVSIVVNFSSYIVILIIKGKKKAFLFCSFLSFIVSFFSLCFYQSHVYIRAHMISSQYIFITKIILDGTPR